MKHRNHSYALVFQKGGQYVINEKFNTVPEKGKEELKKELLNVGCVNVMYSNILFKGTRECLITYPADSTLKIDTFLAKRRDIVVMYR